MCKLKANFIVIILLQLVIFQTVTAETMALEFGDDDFNIDYRVPAIHGASIILDTRLLYSKQNSHQDLFGMAGLTVHSGGHASIGAGFKIIAADPLDNSLTAMTLGIDLLYHARRIRFETSYYTAGNSQTYADGKSVSLFVINLDYEITGDTFIRIGHREIKTELINGIDLDFDRGSYFGLLWSF